MNDSRNFAEKGFRLFDGAATLDLTIAHRHVDGEPLKVFLIETWTDTVLSDTEGDCSFVGGAYSPDATLLGATIPAGKQVFCQFEKLTIASGSGIVYLR